MYIWGMEYRETRWDYIYAGSDGELYTSYYGGFTKKKTRIRRGIKTVGIKKGVSKRYISVGFEIALVFIPNPKGYGYVKEIDGDPMNTSLDNLCWSKNNRRDYNEG